MFVSCPQPPPGERRPAPPEARAAREAHNRTLPGWQLQQLIARRLGQQAVAGCGCGSMVAQMNTWGTAGCREHIEEITDRLVEVATTKEWNLGAEPGVDPADVGKPVPQTRRTRFLRLLARVVSSTDTGADLVRRRCRAMALLAIRRAERGSAAILPI